MLSLLISFGGFVSVALRLCRDSSSSSDVYKFSENRTPARGGIRLHMFVDRQL